MGTLVDRLSGIVLIPDSADITMTLHVVVGTPNVGHGRAAGKRLGPAPTINTGLLLTISRKAAQPLGRRRTTFPAR